MQAAELFEQKIKPPEVARCLRVSRKSAYQWHQLTARAPVCFGAEAARALRGITMQQARTTDTNE
ncbi:helix-turn-helix domain-containing protein [Streptomyces griseorubiginosus]